ncbi:MAG TPA: transglycosylase SLT domain-containing protein [Marmoricola sp.]|nr:transglycosylase SLT domain-containing protein [Marmoricola sp.]
MGHVRRLAGSLIAAAVSTTVLVTSAGAAVGAAPATGRPWPGHPDRKIVMHTVRSGDTVTGLAVRYHAWTDELRRINHLGRHAVLYVGERVRIPVVVSVVRKHRHYYRTHHAPRHHAAQQHSKPQHSKPHPGKPRPGKHSSTPHHHESLHQRGWRHYRMSRAEVARRIAAEARRQGVAPSLAQAIGWQESGWYQPVVSRAGAIGVMQLLPSTGRWMEGYVGRPLNLRDTYDNVRAGVVLLDVLQRNTKDTRHAIGAYYQGLGGVQRHGLYPDTRRYVKSVRAIQRRIAAGRAP